MTEKMTCSRCGKELSIVEFTVNSGQFFILGIPYMLHFCDACINLIKEGRE